MATQENLSDTHIPTVGKRRTEYFPNWFSKTAILGFRDPFEHKDPLSAHMRPWTYSAVPTDYTRTTDIDTEPDGSLYSSILHEPSCGVAEHSVHDT